jgi:hypothetical protein
MSNMSLFFCLAALDNIVDSYPKKKDPKAVSVSIVFRISIIKEPVSTIIDN